MRAVVAAVLVAAMVVVGAASGAGRDPLTGVWVAVDVAGDGSTDRYIYGGPDASGVRNFAGVESYGSFCETDGEGTGSEMVLKGTAVLGQDGETVTTTIYTVRCANGSPGAFPLPPEGLTGQSTLTDAGLDTGYYVAVRSGT